MSIRPAFHMAGPSSSAFVAASLALTLLSTLPSAASADGKEILTKTLALYKNAKSFQGTVIVKEIGSGKNGKQVVITRTERIQYQSPNKFHVEANSVASGLDTAQIQQLQAGNLKIFCDGKQTIIYSPLQNKFAKRPAPPAITLFQISEVLLKLQAINISSVKMLPNGGTVQGRPVVMIESVLPPLPKTATPEEQKKLNDYLKTIKQSPRFSVDKEKNTLLNITQSIAGLSLQIDFTSQLFNPALPPSSFQFAAPKGATVVQAKPASGPPQMNPGGKPK